MFIRKKPNKTGSISVQIIDKSSGKYKVAKTIGSSRNPKEIKQLEIKARNFLIGSQLKLFKTSEEVVVENFLQDLSNSQIHTIGPELIFGTLFDRIGFNAIKEKLFRHIVIARLTYPTSKLKTADYLYRYKGIFIDVQSIYRFLDRLNEKYKEQAEKIAYEYTQKTLGQISVVFYDMTTLYFESEDEDDLRKIGFSKDGKFQNPQIMLGLLVGQNGYPIGSYIFEGNTFEGKTLLRVLNSIQKRYHFGKPVVVADAAMLSQDNLEMLNQQKYPFIVAARIRNETEAVQDDILQRYNGLSNGQSVEIIRQDGYRLIVAYSDQRAKKDAHNRQHGLARLRKRLGSGRMTKEHLNNRGYNKFLKLSGKISIEIDQAKVEQAVRWDGLKGYLTNTKLSAAETIENYGQLWNIEKAFRISKTDLRIRPMYHRRRKRIEAHVLIAFVAYTIYKELERRLHEAGIAISPNRAAELSQTMYEMSFRLPNDPEQKKVMLQMDADQQQLYHLIY